MCLGDGVGDPGTPTSGQQAACKREHTMWGAEGGSQGAWGLGVVGEPPHHPCWDTA